MTFFKSIYHMTAPTIGGLKSLKEIISDRFREAMEAALHDIGRAVRPIYVALPNGDATHLGSGMLVQMREQRLLVTAAHIVDENSTASLYIPAAGSTTRLEGNGVVTTPPGGLRRRDKFDFAVLKITPTLAAQLGNTRYISEDEFVKSDTTMGRAYMALGYPNSRNREINHRERTIKPSKLSYGATIAQDPVFAKKLGLTGNDHYFVKYDKRSRDPKTRAIVNSVTPTGMSGGGLFDLGRFDLAALSMPPRNIGLAGVLIEYHRQHRRMVAVKIEALIESINSLISTT